MRPGDGSPATGVEWAVNGPPLPLRDGFAEFALGALDDVVSRTGKRDRRLSHKGLKVFGSGETLLLGALKGYTV